MHAQAEVSLDNCGRRNIRFKKMSENQPIEVRKIHERLRTHFMEPNSVHDLSNFVLPETLFKDCLLLVLTKNLTAVWSVPVRNTKIYKIQTSQFY